MEKLFTALLQYGFPGLACFVLGYLYYRSNEARLAEKDKRIEEVQAEKDERIKDAKDFREALSEAQRELVVLSTRSISIAERLEDELSRVRPRR